MEESDGISALESVNMELLPEEYDFANSLVDEFYGDDGEEEEEGGRWGEETVYPSWRVRGSQ